MLASIVVSVVYDGLRIDYGIGCMKLSSDLDVQSLAKDQITKKVFINVCSFPFPC